MKNWNFKSWLKLTAAFLSLCLTTSCNFFQEDEPETELEKLPPITTTGENTFGCLVNGKAWVPETSIDANAFYQSGILSISGSLNSKAQVIGITLFDSALTSGKLNKVKAHELEFKFSDTSNGIIRYEEILSGELKILNLDQSEYIISGTFSFQAALEDCNSSCNTIDVTNGRFDLHYAP